MKKDTIAAISTGMTNAGIGIVRISGNEAFEVIDRIYKGKEILSEADSHTIHYGFIQKDNENVDEVLVSVMKAPKTFTGEDIVEINCHGGTFVLQKVLETVLENGARAAEPGEFTKRAFLNGKIDLSQAEAVIDVIQSQNEYALKSSVSQLKGSVRRKIEEIRKEILYHTAFIETALDDPEHISVDGYGEKLQNTIEKIKKELKKLISSADDGRILKEGIQTVIVGKPNAGKSSLLNVLSGRERAIVTDIEGTTRDILEEQIHLQGLNLNMIDTAGIRETEDIIEKMGVEKAKEYIKAADLIIYVVDASRNLDENDEKILNLVYNKKAIILLNKSDLDTVITKEDIEQKIEEVSSVYKTDEKKKENNIPMIDISAKKEQGIREFEETLKRMFLRGNISFNDEIYITNLRQKEALKEAVNSLEKVTESINNQMPEDFYSIDLMDAYEILGSITGETIGEDLVNEIFSKFCMGK
ncbi:MULTISPECIES: tRNA uridine-5-carboxymethylaminomethyl(34) synthesis GTPase MnmE [Lachnospiraceae]|uniref:tRNA modification GTPase MnmE n=1 Tax=Faecalicatena acetigenes TaxID=2981790 RepID=A0ABT2TDK6_9FIRM|nr:MULTISPECIES: tRNA uridine-5-carboxymethylaminomethyl(34) synthesis GTPase MnmE [Lachnospiraceae]MCU6748364.1 tRNA uridine-5-carboxymethylaminomethyl(34) synthesis GTPase MnmE [Faecalicatena acetigenes]RGT73868.1 tRNA uridine-5-carboxymethylaminomethyl(34) synthesis GTPase MnmE [Ruminococcus sp. AF18-22]SCI40232.1 tRNA modification GTPase MnmE [uncultured Clostridium sp.]